MEETNKSNLMHFELTGQVLNCCFEVMKELGPGFLEVVYKNALFIALRQKGLNVETEKPFKVEFRGKIVARYSADLIVEKLVIVELKCSEHLAPEHQAQLINYLSVSRLPVGLLVNFKRRKLDYKRLHLSEPIEMVENFEESILF